MQMQTGQKVVIEPNPSDYVCGLKKLLEEFSELLETAGIPVDSYTPDSMRRFETYPLEVQKQIYGGFIKYVSAVLDVVADGIPLENTEKSLWCLFKKHHLRPRPELFSSIEREDFITIYLPNHVQWYRSFNYYRISSYSLGELICIPWHELYEHQNDHMSHFREITEDIFSNRVQESIFPDFGPTISKELFSSRKLVASLEPKICSPLTGRHGMNEALIVSWKIRVLGSTTPDPGSEFEVRPLTSLQPVNVLTDGSHETSGSSRKEV